MLHKTLSILQIFIIVILLGISFDFPVQAQVDDRRVEENKRKELQTTEQSSSSEMGGEVFSKPPPMDPLDRMYFAELIMKKVTYHYDLCKIISLLLEKENEYITLDAQIMLLRENHFLPPRLEKDFIPQEPLRKGVAAFIFTKALGIRGGWSIRILGLSEHSAINELVYENIMSAGNAKELLSGEELISIFTQAVNYRKSHAL